MKNSANVYFIFYFILIFTTSCSFRNSNPFALDPIKKPIRLNTLNNSTPNTNIEIPYDESTVLSLELLKKTSLKSCQSCHSEPKKSDFTLITNQDYQSQADSILQITQNKKMPPIKKGYQSLNPCEISILKKWIELGTPIESTFKILSLPECQIALPVEPVKPDTSNLEDEKQKYADYIKKLDSYGSYLDHSNYLNKISLALTGQSLPKKDLEKIKSLNSESDIEQFIDNKIDQLLKSPFYFEKMKLKIEELFYFRSKQSSDLLSSALILNKTQNNYIGSSANENFLLNITKNNLSWDQLLTGKSYTLFPGAPLSTSRLTDYGFYSGLEFLDENNKKDSTLLSQDGQQFYDQNDLFAKDLTKHIKKITFPIDDLRIAGLLTTPQFFSRYGTTGLNKNRRRAAAIFRIFLCDELKTQVVPDSQVEKNIIDLIFPKSTEDEVQKISKEEGMSIEDIKAILNKDDSLHGSKKDCLFCHSKLDPAGETFKDSSLKLSTLASPGSLHFLNQSGKTIHTDVAGIGELAKAITEQPEYVSCQTNHFWRWFIGEDIKPPYLRKKEIEEAFEATQRKTNDFIKYLVKQKEFRLRKVSEPKNSLALSVKKILTTCQNCHNGSEDYFGVDLAKWPYEENGPTSNAKYWVDSISKEVDLENDGANKKMPPSPEKGGYNLTADEIRLLKLWVQSGAPDE